MWFIGVVSGSRSGHRAGSGKARYKIPSPTRSFGYRSQSGVTSGMNACWGMATVSE